MALTDFIKTMSQDDFYKTNNKYKTTIRDAEIELEKMDGKFWSKIIAKNKAAEELYNDNPTAEHDYFMRKTFLEMETEVLRCEMYKNIIQQPERKQFFISEFEQQKAVRKFEINALEEFVFGKQIKLNPVK